MRCFTRLTNAFSKKVENHEHAVLIHFMHYNFCRIHQTLRVTPAMAAGLCDHVMELDDICSVHNQGDLFATYQEGIIQSDPLPNFPLCKSRIQYGVFLQAAILLEL